MLNDVTAYYLLFVYCQLMLVPILGLLFLGIRRERKARDLQLSEALRALRVVGVSKGRHLR